MITLELTSSEADLVKQGLEVIAEQIDDAHNVCWNLINQIEEQENNDVRLYVSRTSPCGFPNIEEF